jgi:N-methylhydantoinase A
MTIYSIGVDIGGTFTDCVVVDDRGRVAHGKVVTTPDDRSIGFFESIADAGRSLGLPVSDLLRRCSRLVHGTTTGTNAIVTRSGACVGLLTTRGHRDVLSMMKGCGRTTGVPADQLMDLVASRAKPVPIVPKQCIEEVIERIDVDGDVVVPLDLQQAKRSISSLLDQGVESVAISLLWSIKNPLHERALAQLVKEMAPDTFISCSSDIVGRVGEYERTTTAVLNAYIGPLMTRYVGNIESSAKERGFEGQVLFCQCAGGAITAGEAKRAPILTINSGPVAGVLGSVTFARDVLQEPNVLTADMGGTTFDVSLVRDFEPLIKDTAILEKYELALPMLDVESIGAGGGSIAWIDQFDRLNVGPRSAGAIPGPVCYALGGTEPTVTDADVILGLIDPDSCVRGDVAIDVPGAERSIAGLGERLALDLYQTAAGINRVVDTRMADLLRRMSEFRGLDPRRLTMIAIGGGGPVHAAFCGREAGIAQVVIPLPEIVSVWSAGGAATEDVVHVFVEPRVLTGRTTQQQLQEAFAPLVARARVALRDDGFSDDSIEIGLALQMKYGQQVYSIDVPVTLESGEDVEERFSRRYAERYGQNAGFAESGIHITSFQVRATGKTQSPPLLLPQNSAPDRVAESSRRVYWPEFGGFAETPVARLSGPCRTRDAVVTGPYLIELPGTVVVVRPGQSASWLESGSVVIDTGITLDN